MREKTVAGIKSRMKGPEIVEKLARTFNVLGDPTRTRIIMALAESELCVAEIGMILDMSHSAVSHQMRALKDLDLVMPRKEGKKVFYSLIDEHIDHLFKECLVHVTEKM